MSPLQKRYVERITDKKNPVRSKNQAAVQAGYSGNSNALTSQLTKNHKVNRDIAKVEKKQASYARGAEKLEQRILQNMDDLEEEVLSLPAGQQVALVGMLKEIRHKYPDTDTTDLEGMADYASRYVRKALVLGAILAGRYGVDRVLARMGQNSHPTYDLEA